MAIAIILDNFPVLRSFNKTTTSYSYNLKELTLKNLV